MITINKSRVVGTIAWTIGLLLAGIGMNTIQAGAYQWGGAVTGIGIATCTVSAYMVGKFDNKQ